MKGKLVIAIFIVAAGYISATAQRHNMPPQPYIDRGACPFECCTYRNWTVEKPTVIRKSMSDNAPIAYRLRKGEKVLGVTGVVITSVAGIAKVLQTDTYDNVALKKGDTVYLLTYIGEGFHKLWHKGRIFEFETYDEKKMRVTRNPQSVWWVKVRNSRGQTGWSRQPNNFGNKDQCGS